MDLNEFNPFRFQAISILVIHLAYTPTIIHRISLCQPTIPNFGLFVGR